MKVIGGEQRLWDVQVESAKALGEKIVRDALNMFDTTHYPGIVVIGDINSDGIYTNDATTRAMVIRVISHVFVKELPGYRWKVDCDESLNPPDIVRVGALNIRVEVRKR